MRGENDTVNTNLLALMPCPLKIPFEQKVSMFVQGLKRTHSVDLNYQIVSNATQQLGFFSKLALCEDAAELPDIMMAPGFSGFFFRRFLERFVNKGFFQFVIPYETNETLKNVGIPDAFHQYTIPCFNPTVLVVDRTLHRDLPLPETWADLLRPEYTGLLALRGHTDDDFCEGILMNTYKDHGLDGIAKLGRATKTGLHPSQMVKYIGSGNPDSPAVSAMPYSFAQLVKEKKHVTLIWPQDGAIVNPLIMMVKAGLPPHLKELAEYIVGREIGEIFAGAFFPSIHPKAQNQLPENASLKWLGWDFLKSNDIEKLKESLNQVFLQSFRGD